MPTGISGSACKKGDYRMNPIIRSGSSAAEIKTAGAELTSLTDGSGTQYLWQGDPAYWASQSPVLFPIVGSIRDGRATAGNGRPCRMDHHGIARHMEFRAEKSAENEAVFTIKSTPETRKRFPFDFEFQVKYTLCGKTLTVAFTAVNRDSGPMPYLVGGHPAFNCPLLEGERFEDYVLEFPEKEYAVCPRVLADGLVDVEHRTLILDNEKIFRLDRTWFSYDCQIFDQLKSRSVRLYNPATNRGVQVDFKGLDYLVIWTSKNGGNFLAIEPWSGTPTCTDEDDVLEHKRGVTILKPGESKTHSYSVTML